MQRKKKAHDIQKLKLNQTNLKRTLATKAFTNNNMVMLSIIF